MFRPTINHILLIFSLLLIGRVLPHPVNITPVTALCVLSGMYLPMWLATPLLILGYLTSDLLLAYLHNFPVLGAWTFYSYTSVFGLVYLGRKMVKKTGSSWIVGIAATLIGSLGFWLWSNFGVWLHSGMYPVTANGCITCYAAALPFLQQSLLGDLFWLTLLMLGISLPRCMPIYSHCFPSTRQN